MAANRQQRADCHAATLQCIADIWYIYNNNSLIARFDGYPVHCLSGLPVFAVNKRGPMAFGGCSSSTGTGVAQRDTARRELFDQCRQGNLPGDSRGEMG